MKLKLLLIIFFLIFIFRGVFAQDTKPPNIPKYDYDPLHFGFTLGINTMDFIIRHADNFQSLDTVLSVNNERKIGFNIAMVSNFRLGRYFDVRFLPGLAFGQRNLVYRRDSANIFNGAVDESRNPTHIMKIESTFLQFPLHIKYKAKRVNNYRPYVIAGVNYCFDLEAQKKIKEEERPKIRLKRNDIYCELGFGIDYYFPFFKLSSELKLSVGLLDVIKPDKREYTAAIDRLNSKMISILFHFE